MDFLSILVSVALCLGPHVAAELTQSGITTAPQVTANAVTAFCLQYCGKSPCLHHIWHHGHSYFNSASYCQLLWQGWHWMPAPLSPLRHHCGHSNTAPNTAVAATITDAAFMAAPIYHTRVLETLILL